MLISEGRKIRLPEHVLAPNVVKPEPHGCAVHAVDANIRCVWRGLCPRSCLHRRKPEAEQRQTCQRDDWYSTDVPRGKDDCGQDGHAPRQRCGQRPRPANVQRDPGRLGGIRGARREAAHGGVLGEVHQSHLSTGGVAPSFRPAIRGL